MFRPHPSFKLPPENTKIWRYTDFAKFTSMLFGRSLFFTRLDCFEDPWEGIFPPGHYDFETIAKSAIESGAQLPVDELVSNLKRTMQLFEKVRPTMAANCWHMNTVESDAFWRIYANMGQGVCVQSNVGRLKEAVESDLTRIVHIGSVSYVDFDTHKIPSDNMFFSATYKRSQFSHEKELRAIIWRLEEDQEANIERRPFATEFGELLPIDLDDLIEEIVVSPMAAPWMMKLVEQVVEKSGCKFPVRRSRLLDPPMHLITSKR